MVKFDDITVPGRTSGTFRVSLSKLIGKPVKDVRGYLSNIGGGITFKLTEIEFDDGTFLSVEGEHDFPYLTEYGRTSQPNFDEPTLVRLYEEGKDR